MSVALTLIDGRLAAEIEDVKGEVFRYLVVRIEGGVRLEKLDPETGAVAVAYQVTHQAGRWSCTCPDFRFRGFARRGLTFCKHCAHATELLPLLGALEGVRP